jgi:hypothetical protein
VGLAAPVVAAVLVVALVEVEQRIRDTAEVLATVARMGLAVAEVALVRQERTQVQPLVTVAQD